MNKGRERVKRNLDMVVGEWKENKSTDAQMNKIFMSVHVWFDSWFLEFQICHRIMVEKKLKITWQTQKWK